MTMKIRKAIFEAEQHIYRDPLTQVVVPSVTQILGASGLINHNGIRKDVLQHKGQIGTEVHFCCALVDNGEDLADWEVDLKVLEYLDQYAELKRLLAWRPTMIENGDIGPAIADINGMLVGFKLDRVGMLGDREAVVEIKCTTTVEPHMGVQLAFYDLCLGPPRRKRAVFQLFPDKFKLHEDSEKDSKVFYPGDYEMCLSALFAVYYRHFRGIERFEDLVGK